MSGPVLTGWARHRRHDWHKRGRLIQPIERASAFLCLVLQSLGVSHPLASRRPAVSRALPVAMLLATGAFGGCGWSPRDEFIHARGMRVPGAAGDQSLIAMGRPDEAFMTADALPPSMVLRAGE